MLDFLKNLFPHADDVSAIISANPVIIDVRTPGEYLSGHIDSSINVPLDSLSRSLAQMPDTSKPIIVCCASGSRSAAAKQILLSKGYTQVYDGGGWTGLRDIILRASSTKAPETSLQ